MAVEACVGSFSTLSVAVDAVAVIVVGLSRSVILLANILETPGMNAPQKELQFSRIKKISFNCRDPVNVDVPLRERDPFIVL